MSATRQIQDIENSLLEEGVQKELKLNEVKYQRILEDLKTNEKLTDTEKTKLKSLFEAEYVQTQDEINKKELARINQFEETAKKIKEDAQAEWIKTIQDIEEQNYVNSLSAKDKELLAVNDKYFALQEAAKGNAEQMAIIEEAKATEVAEINDKAAKDEIARLQAVADAKLAIQNEDLAMVSQGIGVLKNIFEKNKAIQKGLLIAENAAGIAKIIINTMASNAKALLLGPVLSVPVIMRNNISAGIGIASSVAATAKGLAALGKGGGATGGTLPSSGGGGSGASGANNTSTQQATPQVNLFGGNNNANTFGANGQPSNQGGEMVVKAIVVEADVTSMQKKMNKVQESAVL